jgi:hypothetical protein
MDVGDDNLDIFQVFKGGLWYFMGALRCSNLTQIFHMDLGEVLIKKCMHAMSL